MANYCPYDGNRLLVVLLVLLAYGVVILLLNLLY